MKTELRLVPHTQVRGANVVEIWHNGEFIGQITGDDGPGIRIFSRRRLDAFSLEEGEVKVMSVEIGVT